MTNALISAREASRVLAGAGLAREQARLLLACGLAGAPTPVGGMLGYDRDAVVALSQRPAADTTVCEPRSILVLRERRGVDPRTNWHAADVAARPLPLGRSAVIWLHVQARSERPTPCLVTVSGFVAGGFDVVGVQAEEPGTRLEVRQAGPWFRQFKASRLPGPAGGREWSWWPRETSSDSFTEVRRRTAVRNGKLATWHQKCDDAAHPSG